MSEIGGQMLEVRVSGRMSVSIVSWVQGLGYWDFGPYVINVA